MVPSISETLEVYRCLFFTYLAALRCTNSIFCISFWVNGSHTVLAYSTRGLTKVKYALSFKDLAPILRFRLKNPIVLWCFQYANAILGHQLGSLRGIWLIGLWSVFGRVACSQHGQEFSSLRQLAPHKLVGGELHMPLVLPCSQIFKVFM